MNINNRSDSALPLLMSIVFAAALLLVPMLTHAADESAEQPETTYVEQTMLAMNGPEADAHVGAAVRHANRGVDAPAPAAKEGLALKLMMHRLIVGQ